MRRRHRKGQTLCSTVHEVEGRCPVPTMHSISRPVLRPRHCVSSDCGGYYLVKSHAKQLCRECNPLLFRPRCPCQRIAFQEELACAFSVFGAPSPHHLQHLRPPAEDHSPPPHLVPCSSRTPARDRLAQCRRPAGTLQVPLMLAVSSFIFFFVPLTFLTARGAEAEALFVKSGGFTIHAFK